MVSELIRGHGLKIQSLECMIVKSLEGEF